MTVANMESKPVQGVGIWRKKLTADLEDEGIVDQHQACIYGYNKALEQVNTWIIAHLLKAIKENES